MFVFCIRSFLHLYYCPLSNLSPAFGQKVIIVFSPGSIYSFYYLITCITWVVVKELELWIACYTEHICACTPLAYFFMLSLMTFQKNECLWKIWRCYRNLVAMYLVKLTFSVCFVRVLLWQIFLCFHCCDVPEKSTLMKNMKIFRNLVAMYLVRLTFSVFFLGCSCPLTFSCFHGKCRRLISYSNQLTKLWRQWPLNLQSTR